MNERAPISRRFNWQLAVRDSDLSSKAKAVAFTLATYMDADGKAWPGRRLIAIGASVDVSTVDRGIRELVARGFLLVERSRGRTSNTYYAVPQPDVNSRSVRPLGAANSRRAQRQWTHSAARNSGTVPPEFVSKKPSAKPPPAQASGSGVENDGVSKDNEQVRPDPFEAAARREVAAAMRQIGRSM